MGHKDKGRNYRSIRCGTQTAINGNFGIPWHFSLWTWLSGDTGSVVGISRDGDLMNRQLFTVIALALTMALFAACGDDSTPPDDTGPKDTFETNDDAQIKDPTIVDENFRVIYGYTPTLSEKAAEMMVGNPAFGPDDDGVPQWTSDFPLVKNSLESLGLNCSYGCYPSRDLGMMAVATGYDASTTGQDVQVVKFDQNMTASPLLMQPLTGVRQAYFVGGALVVSRFHSCETKAGATKTCYRFERVDFSDESVEPAAEELFVFPTDAMLEDSMYSGRFRVGADGRSLIIQNPEKESVSLWIYTSSEGLRQIGDRICQTVDANGDCAYSSTAPALTDDSPVALTKDGKTLLFAYVDDDTEFRIASFDTATGDTESTTLVKTPANYLTNVCYNFTGDWKYTRIQPPLLISADGAEVVFVAASECKPGVDKTLTDIIAVPSAMQ